MGAHNLRKSFLEASPKSGHRFRCSPSKNGRQNKNMNKAESMVHAENHCK